MQIYLPFGTRFTGYEKTSPVARLADTGSLFCDERRGHHSRRGISFLGKLNGLCPVSRPH
jgi:hypothetical protein